MEKEQWGTIAAIVYFSLYAVLLIIIAICAHIHEEHESKKSFMKSIWNRRGIYGQILVHLYDTATDIGVLIQWGILAQQEKSGDETDNIISLDMNGLFWTSIAFLILYRVISIIIACISGVSSGYVSCCFDVFLALIDMYVIKAVYQAIKGNAEEPTKRQKMIQLTEAIFESLPQVVLQSVFIIRWYNHDKDGDQYTMYLVGMSLFASLFSISNKFSWVDKDACDEDDYKFAGCSKSCPIVNPYYVLRIIWRYSYITTRFAMISLLWSVLGGAFSGIFLACSWLLWFVTLLILISADQGMDCELFIIVCMYAIVCLVATPATGIWSFAVVHGCEVLFTMSIITWFAFDSSMDCGICADPSTRQANNNPYILSFIIAGWVTMLIDFVSYILVLIYGIFDEDLNSVFAMYTDGVQSKATTK
eukprot:24563_1